MEGKIRIKLVRSPICTPEKHKIIVRSLGLRKINQMVERPDTPGFRGMVKKIPHLVDTGGEIVMHEFEQSETSGRTEAQPRNASAAAWDRAAARPRPAAARAPRSVSGYSIMRGFEGGQMPLHRRLPKRGFTNIFKKQYAIVNLGRLEKLEGDQFNAGPADRTGRDAGSCATA